MKIDMIKLDGFCQEASSSSEKPCIVELQRKLDNSRALKMLEDVIAKSLRNFPDKGIIKG